jgi:hypothetical protein
MASLKNPRSCIGLRPQSAFTDFRSLLPSANNSAEWSGRVWQPSADSNGHLEHIFFKFEAPQMAICRGLSYPTQQVQNLKRRAPNGHYFLQRAVAPNLMGSIALWEHITTFFSRAEKPSEDKNSSLFFMNKKELSMYIIKKQIFFVFGKWI